MLKKTLFNIFLIFLSIYLLIGCNSLPFFNNTELTLNSYEIVDDLGFASIFLKFNVTDKITLNLINPNGNNLFTEDYYFGYHEVKIPLDDYKITPLHGLYEIKAFDYNNQQIFNKKINFENYNLTISNVILDWWLNDKSYDLVGLELTFKNFGDLPAYPNVVTSEINNIESDGLIIPTVILPKENKKVYCYMYLSDVLIESSSIKLSITDSKGFTLADSTYAVNFNKDIPNMVFSWNFNGFNRLIIPDIDFLYDYYKNLDRIISEDYTSYIFNVYDNSYIDLVADDLSSLSNEIDDVSMVNFLVSFVQSLTYAEDDDNDTSCEYPRFPVEMLKDSKGDCEDKAILTATLLDSIGYNVSLIRLPNHMAVGVYLDQDLPLYDYYIDKYYYLETTRSRWSLGKVPDEYRDETNISVYPLSSRPILFHDWINATRFSTTDKSDYVKLKIIVENFGSKTANNFNIIAAFFDENNFKFNEETVSISSLNPGDKKLVTLKIDVPLDFSSTLKTQIYLDDEMVNEKVSSSLFP